jgi:YD repeat-containing protein
VDFAPPTYNLDGELAAVDHAGHVARIERDALGREIRRALPGGAALVTTAYDSMGRLAAQEVSRPVHRDIGISGRIPEKRGPPPRDSS